MTFLDHLDWRHATKAFNPTKSVSDEDVQHILDSIRMTPTSFGLQPYKVYVITDQALQEKIRPHAWDQAQITTGSHLLVFASRTDMSDRITGYIETASGGDEMAKAKLSGYEEMMRNFLPKMTLEWAHRQTYIALGFAMAACAEREVDSCPIEGFDPAKIDEILELPDHIKSVVLLPIGVRAEDPKRDKVRFGEDELFAWR